MDLKWFNRILFPQGILRIVNKNRVGGGFFLTERSPNYNPKGLLRGSDDHSAGTKETGLVTSQEAR